MMVSIVVVDIVDIAAAVVRQTMLLLSFLALLKSRNFGGRQKSSARSTWSAHCVFVARLVEILFF